MESRAGGDEEGKPVFPAIAAVTTILTLFLWMWSTRSTVHQLHDSTLPAIVHSPNTAACGTNGAVEPPSGNTTELHSPQVGFYMQLHSESDAYVSDVLAGIRVFYPANPITVVSDNGNDYSAVCQAFAARFVMANETINVDKSRPPYTYTCQAHMLRVVEAAAAMETPWMFLWESDARAMGRLPMPPYPFDVMQMHANYNCFTRFGNLEAFLRRRFPRGLAPMVHGWGTTGGTLFNVAKLAKAVAHAGQPSFHSNGHSRQTNQHRSFSKRVLKFRHRTLTDNGGGDTSRTMQSTFWSKSPTFDELKSHWEGYPDTTADICLFASTLMANMTIGNWAHYSELERSYETHPGCAKCIASCKSTCGGYTYTLNRARNSADVGRTGGNSDGRSNQGRPPDHAVEQHPPPMEALPRFPTPPPVDRCIYSRC